MAQPARGVPNVGPDGFHEVAHAELSSEVGINGEAIGAVAGNVAEVVLSRRSGFGVAHAARHELVDARLDVKAQLVVDRGGVGVRGAVGKAKEAAESGNARHVSWTARCSCWLEHAGHGFRVSVPFRELAA